MEKLSSSGNSEFPHWALITVIFKCLRGESKSAGCKSQNTREGLSVVRRKLVGELSWSVMRKATVKIINPTTVPMKLAVRERSHSEREARFHHKVHSTRAMAGGATSQTE